MDTFIPIATADEIADASSWINTRYHYSQSEYDAFFKALGEALATWAMVEMRLEGIFHLAIGSNRYHAVSATFMSTEGFRPKLKMTGGALRHCGLQNLDMATWDTLAADLRTASGKRNDIVHHTAFYDHHAPADRHFFISKGGPNGVGSRRHRIDLAAITENFTKLDERLAQFWSSLAPA